HSRGHAEQGTWKWIMSIPIRFPLFRRQPPAEHLSQFLLTTRKPGKPERPPNLRLGDSFLTSEQNRDTDKHEADRHQRRSRNQTISPRVLGPFLANQEEQRDQEKIRDEQRK